ncbi:hypothetical protein FRB90_002873 [Tulasnella sp. 427]|nr:hypothetical protein FRB90_002873 [Tulasnella sp. 427]
MPRMTSVLLVTAALATSILAYPVEWDTSHRLEARGTSSTSSSKKNRKLNKTETIILCVFTAGVFGLAAIVIACSMCKTWFKDRRARKVDARKDRIEHSHAKPGDLEEVNKYPELFETPSPERLDGSNAHPIHSPPPPSSNTRNARDDMDIGKGMLDKQPVHDKSAPVARDAWKQGTVVSPSMPEPTSAEPSRPDDKHSGGRHKSRQHSF